MLESLQLASDGVLSFEEDGSFVGLVTGKMFDVLWWLSQMQGMSLQLRCVIKQPPDGAGSKRKEKGTNLKLCASVFGILYGPLGSFDAIGEFLEDNNIFLQDPQGCDRNVRYRNPHRLSGMDRDAPMTIDRELSVKEVRQQGWESSSNYLDDLDFRENLPLADIPHALNTQLFKHQRQALYFMLERERGWSFTGELSDIWKLSHISGLRMYMNTINDEVQMEPPIIFRGGLLADQMGLGKTLSIISLVASDLDLQQTSSTPLQSSLVKPSSHCLQCTLIVVLPNLLDTWELQLRRHCQPEKLHWIRHHRRDRFTQLAQLAPYNIILTTFHTVATEWKNRHSTSSVLFSARWHRIVLDEAHLIRDKHTQLAQAVCALEADRRWAVTGTPIQNHVTDFVALLRFLRVHPYDQPSMFEYDIVNLWKNDSEAAITRLKKLITCIGLRRTGGTIDLPERMDQIHILQFSVPERELYEPIESQVMSILNQADQDDAHSGHHLHALQGLHALRSICNFGTLSDTKRFDKYQLATPAWGPTEAQDVFDGLVTAGDIFCTKCTTDNFLPGDAIVPFESEKSDVVESQPVVSQCARILCSSCNHKLQGQSKSDLDWCGHTPHCKHFPVFTSKPCSELTRSLGTLAVDPEHLPTKMRALIRDIRLFPASNCVVFSTWRSTLDLAAYALHAAAIPFVRFDGKVADKDRTSALSQLSHDASIKVILFTISCGAVGLDLTAADRAYLMEPQWNPTVEDQAFARVHRMGQQKPVTTVRFVIADSYEQRVIEVQKRKKNFADLLLSPRKKALPSSIGLTRFECLRSLLS